MVVNTKQSLSILDHFKELVDPRRESSCKHKLLDIVAIALCGVLCGSDDFVSLEVYGHKKKQWLSTFLDLSEGIPSHDTFRRVFGKLDPKAFGECFAGWMAALQDELGLKVIAIDGKTLRRSGCKSKEQKPLHLVSAWATENQLSLGQVATEEKSNEITAIPPLLELLEISGALVTIDARGCQKEIAKKIRQKGGDYVLALKENHPTLYQKVSEYFDEILDTEQGEVSYQSHQTEESGHGRLEFRNYFTVTLPEYLKEFAICVTCHSQAKQMARFRKSGFGNLGTV